MKSKIYTNFQDIPPFIRWSSYLVDMWWTEVDRWIESHAADFGVELDPDFQRGHVWTRDKQIAYVEHCLRGGRSSNVIHWNCHDWHECTGKHPLVLVDGKQRLEAVRAFLRGDIPTFGTHYAAYSGFMRPLTGATFKFHVNGLKTRAEVLEWYLELNAGGVVHTDEELDKVRKLLQEEKDELQV
jgi:hypothetical protein